jgi:mannosyl-3-phosphoglycerate phosphatase
MRYIFFTDLDGTLLDHDTYSHEPAREALALLRGKKYPLVMVSSKTFPEMKSLHDELGLRAPFIFENGGGISWPGEQGKIEIIGKNVSALRDGGDGLRDVLGERVRFITDMDPDEISRITGLTRERAMLSRQRKTSLPFIIPSGKIIRGDEIDRINTRLVLQGLSITKGGRFYHLLSTQADKGSAIIKVIDFYREKATNVITTVGIGDSENDIAMFRVVDIPVLVRKNDGSTIDTGMGNISVTRLSGPRGFNEAVTGIIKEGDTNKGAI